MLVLVALIVLLAGCAGDPGESDGTVESGTVASATASTTNATASTTGATASTTTESAGTTTTGSQPTAAAAPENAVNESRVFERVAALLDVNATGPTVTWTERERSSGAFFPVAAFPDALGVEPAEVDSPHSVGGYTVGPDDVRISYGPDPSVAALRVVLVHEYVHAIQQQSAAYEGLGTTPDDQASTIARAITEGAATYATNAYANRHGDLGATRPRICEDYETGATVVKLRFGPYCEGARYAAWRLDDSTGLTDLYRSPPTTTEQVRHNLTASDAPARPLAVDARDGEQWTARRGEAGATRRGELWTYGLLTAFLDAERADRAATGWGNDALVRYDYSRHTGWAWVTRWDSPRDADEFASAMSAHARNASGRVGPRYDVDVRRVNATVVAVVAGPKPFVADATVGAEDDVVVVRPPSTNDSDATTETTARTATLGPQESLVGTETPPATSASRTAGTSHARTSCASRRGSNP